MLSVRLLTGAPPFVRDQATAMIWAHMSQPPLLTARRPDLPTAVGQVLAQGLAKAPTDRYRNCGEFADALGHALGLAPYRPYPGAVVTDHPLTEIAWPADRGGMPRRPHVLPEPPRLRARRLAQRPGQDDDRDLFPQTLRLVTETGPRAVLLENVPGLANRRFDDYRAQVLDQLRALGYQAWWDLVQASDHGVLQLRPRFVLVAMFTAVSQLGGCALF
jgi:C-5 cytosine-specific DNA methylase